MSCEPYYYSGIGQCKALRENIWGLLIKEKTTTLTKAAAKTEVGLKTALFPSTGVKGVILDLTSGFEPAGGENELTTSNLQFTVKTDVTAIQAVGYANLGYNDYNLLRSLEGKRVEIVMIDAKGNLVNTNYSNANVTGFRGKFFMTNGFSKVGADKQKDMMFTFYFEDLSQWGEKEETIITAYSGLNILENFQPVGLDCAVVAGEEYAAGGDFTVKVTYRGEERPYAGLTTDAKWSVLYANGDIGATLTVSDATNAALGLYVMNCVNGTPADMADWFKIQGADNDGTYITYITNPVDINR